MNNLDLKNKEQVLFKEYQKGNQIAKQELLQSMAPVINSQVSKFAASGLPTPALRLEAQRLTLDAFKTYDPNKAQLNTHVTNGLKKLSRFVTEYQNVGHIPEPRAFMIGRYNTVKENLKDAFGREPTMDELADALSIPISEISRLQLELRNDLSTSIIEEDEDGGGFYQYSNITEDPKIKEAVDFVYFDADPIDKKILEYTLGLHNVQKKLNKDIAVELRLTDSELKKKKENLAKSIKELI